jgi:nicotinamide mononucleotide transporter
MHYPISLLELLGTISGLACVYLTAKENILCWPVGIVNIILFFILFYQVQLYSDMILQVYFLIMSIYGWWKWANPRTIQETDVKNELKVSDLSKDQWIYWVSGTLVATLLLGYFMQHIHIYFPKLFVKRAAFPFPDATTTTLSMAATVIMALKKRDCWILWILVDIIATIIYFLKGINLVAIEYIIFGIISANGYITWTRIKNKYEKEAWA